MQAVASKLWLWFYYLIPANPILVRVVQGASKRPRHLWMRVAYLSGLLGLVLISLFLALSGKNASLAELAKDASQTFTHAAIGQLALMCFLAPAFTASAITQERDAQTFNILLSTPLSSAQIVFGSLMSRLYFVLVLLLAGLPIFLMTMVYGGVTSGQIIECFLLAGSTAILTGALAIFVAMLGTGSGRTIFSFYLIIALYLIFIYLAATWWDGTWLDVSTANLDGRRMSWLTALHPFLALDVALNRIYAPPISRLGDYSSLAQFALAHPSAAYVTWTLLLAFLLTLASVALVRRGAKTGEPTFLSSITDRFRKQPAGDRTRTPRTVWKNPVAWREAKTRAAGGMPLRWALIAGGFTGPLILFYYHVDGGLTPDEIQKWLAAVIIIQFALALLMAANTAATSITKEKESLSMDLLLTTPLTSRYILWGKLRGLVSFTFPLILGPVSVLMLFALHGLGAEDPTRVAWIETVFEVGVLLVIYTALACVIGLWRSLNSKTNVAATMHSLGLLILLCGGASLIGFAVAKEGSGEFGAFLAPFTPFTAIRYHVHPRALFNTAAEFAQGAGRVRLSGLIGSIVAALLYTFVVWRLYAGLVRNFDMTLRKQTAN